MLDAITHIWISHEHPDHFSISFFKSYADKIKERSIKILFQNTKDKRVLKFLSAQGFDVQELDFNKQTSLSSNFTVTCIKDGFYDSGLLIESNDEKILNLNDCEVTTDNRVNEVFSITGEVDVLLTQFSFAAWLTGKKIIWELNDTYTPKMIRIIFFFLSHLADGFLYASLKTKKYYNKLVPKKNKYFLIQSPVDINFFDPSLNYNTNKLRKKINLINKLVIGTVCNINPVKGLDTYIEVAKAFSTNKDIIFLIIGEKYKSQENYFKYLLSLIKKYNLKNINFIGLTKDVRPYLKLIDVYVCTSKNESSPLSIWEAMSMQKPIVSTDVGDVKKFIINNVNGFILRVGDKQSLVKSIKKLTENQKLRIKFGKNSRKIAKKELNIKKCIKLHVNAYEEILRNF